MTNLRLSLGVVQTMLWNRETLEAILTASGTSAGVGLAIPVHA